MIGAKPERARPRAEEAGRRVRRWGRALATGALDFFVFKPIAVFVAWLSGWANRVHFERRRELRVRPRPQREADRQALLEALARTGDGDGRRAEA